MTTVQGQWLINTPPRNIVQENHFIKSLTYLTSNGKVMPSNWVIIRLGAKQSEGQLFFYTIQKRKGRTKINVSVKQDIYDCVIQHPNVVKSPISYDCIKMSVDVQS